MGRLEGKVAVVTAAAGGIAGASARRFAAEGARVLVCDIDMDGAGKTVRDIAAAGGTAEARHCDVADPESASAAVEAAVRAFGAVHVLMNGAAIREPVANVVELDLADWERAMRVNLTGIFLMCKYAIPRIAEAGGGSVINVASQLGSVVVPDRPAYVTSKAAVIQLSKSMALDFAKDKVRVNSLSPGATETGRLLAHYGTMEAVRRALTPLHPIGRLGRPEDLADAALYLATDESAFVTGHDLIVDGGYTAV
ncbi:MAG: SDR family oxidoreductase [Defluviicoccus sp.]|nr:SDR family oxidoreductase [Defluviicoccus sp.]MDE0385762.1 SDR family oxidoreductase [Defluviicoccus sp.]